MILIDLLITVAKLWKRGKQTKSENHKNGTKMLSAKPDCNKNQYVLKKNEKLRA